MNSRPRALVVGGLDPSCGAGIVLDAFVLAALGFAPAAVTTVVTAQNSARFLEASPVDPELLSKQLEAAAETPFAFVKAGALGSAANARALAKFLAASPRAHREYAPLVVDPVLASSSGGELLSPTDIAAYDDLCPLATIITPNAEEATLLSGQPVRDVSEAEEAAGSLASRWGCAVVVTGLRRSSASPDADEVIDVLVYGDRAARLSHPLVPGAGDVRGTGCAFACALAASLARDSSLPNAVRDAQHLVTMMVAGAQQLGTGRRQADLAALLAPHSDT